MKALLRLSLFLLLAIPVLSSCDKDKERTTSEKGLLPNQIDEPDGIRFILTWAVANETKPQNVAHLDLELYKGVGPNRSTTPIALIPNPHSFINYSVLEGALTDGEEHTLVIKYGNLERAGAFDLYIEGYTAIANKKNFKIVNTAFTQGSAHTTKDFLKIKRTGTVYTFTVL